MMRKNLPKQLFRRLKNAALGLLPKNPRNRQIVVLICLAAIVVFSLAGYYIYRPWVARVDCLNISGKAKDAITQKRFSEGYNEVKIYYKNCGVSDKSKNLVGNSQNSRVKALEFSADAAKLAYLSGDKDAAKGYATDGLELNSKMTEEERSSVPGQAILYFMLQDIKDGRFEYTEGVAQ